jgi:transcriptional regulator with PAS, ATPase and Fis domain
MKSINAFGGMSGRSSAINVVNTLIHKASFNDYPVLITGETGVGKSLAAECIHRFSRRKEKFFLHQSCSNISSDLFESDFFGHEKGTFTGAVEKKIGKIELAEGGSVFLDEISEISPQSQSKFLLFLDKGKFFRLGGLKEISADVRIMAATNRDLEKEMKAGCFRRDLYYRLNVFEIHIPSLKERKEDIPLLIDEILSEAEERNRTRKRMSPQAVQKLIEYDFSGKHKKNLKML